MDMETGENLYDSETGEMMAKPLRNLETGECELNRVGPTSQKCRKPFKIPNEYIKQEKEKQGRTTQNILTRANVENRMSPIIVFLLPTTVFFVPIVSIFLGIAELFLHIWAHKKNKSLKNQNIYYQSPLHVIVSEFCACCRDESMKNKIGKIQDKRNNKFTKYGIDYIRCIVK